MEEQKKLERSYQLCFWLNSDFPIRACYLDTRLFFSPQLLQRTYSYSNYFDHIALFNFLRRK